MVNFLDQMNQKFEAGDPLGRNLGLHHGPLDKPKPGITPYDAQGQQVQWDETGRPIGIQQQKGTNALDWQYEADRRTEQRRQGLWGDAQNSMRQGADLMQSYRAGGSAALASGIYQNKASLYATQSLNTESPDLLGKWRNENDERAKRERKRAEKTGQIVGLVQAGAALVGSIYGGPAVGAAAGAAVGAAGQSLVGNTNPNQRPEYQVGGGQGGRGGVAGPVGGGSGSVPGAPGGVPGGGSAGARPAGAPGSIPRGGGGVPGGPGANGGGGAAGLSGSGSQGGMAGGYNGPTADGGMSMFSPQEAAYNAMQMNVPQNGPIYTKWASSAIRKLSTDARVNTSMARMLGIRGRLPNMSRPEEMPVKPPAPPKDQPQNPIYQH